MPTPSSPIAILQSLLSPRGMPAIAILSFDTTPSSITGWLQFATGSRRATYGFTWVPGRFYAQQIRPPSQSAAQATPAPCRHHFIKVPSTKARRRLKNPSQDLRLPLRITVRGVLVEKALRATLKALMAGRLRATIARQSEDRPGRPK